MPTQPPDPSRIPGYTVIEPTDGRGVRFVAFSLLPEHAKAFCDLARQLGVRPTDASSFITESKSH